MEEIFLPPLIKFLDLAICTSEGESAPQRARAHLRGRGRTSEGECTSEGEDAPQRARAHLRGRGHTSEGEGAPQRARAHLRGRQLM